jgi:Arc/MetJ-type ribon-helix-helix transcriptional regulator
MTSGGPLHALVKPTAPWYENPSYQGALAMPAAKVAITIEEQLLKRIDRLVAQRKFPNRSRAIQEAVRDKLDRLDRGRLARECAKLNPAAERKIADEGLARDFAEWPEF